MAEVTVRRIEAFHRALVQGGAARLGVAGQRLTPAAALELTCALYHAGRSTSEIGIDRHQQGMWNLICASGWPWKSKIQELRNGNCGLRILAGNQSDVGLIAFAQELQRSLKGSVGDSVFPRAVAGAFVEMAENIGQHSMTSKPGLVGYDILDGRITCCFADLGVGVLNSLRLNPAYKTLQTSAQALDEALKDGVSRFSELGRGHGFSDLLRAITEQWGMARIRTGQAKLVLDRTTEHRTKTIGYSPELPGLQIVFACSATRPSSICLL